MTQLGYCPAMDPSIRRPAQANASKEVAGSFRHVLEVLATSLKYPMEGVMHAQVTWSLMELQDVLVLLLQTAADTGLQVRKIYQIKQEKKRNSF